jgi:hypothetical protein
MLPKGLAMEHRRRGEEEERRSESASIATKRSYTKQQRPEHMPTTSLP